VTQARWKQVIDIFSAALEVDAAARDSFLASRCGDDQELRKNVEALLSSHDRAGDFIEQPVLASGQLEDVLRENEGRRIGAYKIVSELGRGGMGDVYLAVRVDNEFQQQVAIKFIRPGMASDYLVRRFRNERQILANLNHANIARLLDGGTTDEGLPYIVMEVVEGLPIDQYCDIHSLTIAERLGIFLKVCSAVSYAHEQGVLHRDLKPGNVVVNKHGSPKLLDFGIAKLLEPDAFESSSAGPASLIRMFTPEYASPEQLKGESATAASDLYSLGVVLYELLTGYRPYDRKTKSGVPWHGPPPRPSSVVGGDEGITRRRSTTPTQLRITLSGTLDNVVMRAIEENPERRYLSVSAFSRELELCLHRIAPSSDVTTAGLVADPGLPTGPISLAILPFQLLGSGTDTDTYLGVGIADALITKLSALERLVVRSTNFVLRFAREEIDPIAVGRELDVRYVLVGRIRRESEHFRITTQLINAQDGSVTWGTQFDEGVKEFLRLEDTISEQVAQAVIHQLTSEERDLLHRRRTDIPKAYASYLKGRYHWNLYTQDSMAQALLYFTEAIAGDPHYALPHAGVADYYNWMGISGLLPPQECFEAAKNAARQALAIDPSLSEAHAALGFSIWAHDWDITAAEREFQFAGGPSQVAVHVWRAFVLSSECKHADAIHEIEQAQKLEPFSPRVGLVAARIFFNAEMPERAIQALRPNRTSGLASFTLLQLASLASVKGETAGALKAAHEAVALSERTPIALAVLSYLLAMDGDHPRARELLREVEQKREEHYVSPLHIAAIYSALGENENAIQELKRGIAKRDWWVLWIQTDPRLKPLRADKRMRSLIQNAAPKRTRHFLKPKALRSIGIAAGVAALAASLAWYFGQSSRSLPFERTRVLRLTTDGDVLSAAISNDGKYLAYTRSSKGQQSLWMRQVGLSGGVQALKPRPVSIRGLSFSKDSSYIHYLECGGNNFDHCSLWRVPILGGLQTKIVDDVRGPAAYSPDDGNIAFVRTSLNADQLVIVRNDGSGARVLTERRHPDEFLWSSSPAWSPDGRTIAAAINQAGKQAGIASIIGIDARSGKTRLLCSRSFQFVEQMGWLPDGQGVLVSGHERDASFQQIWLLPVNGEDPLRITNDLSDYSGISATSALAFTAVQTQLRSGIFVSENGEPSNAQLITGDTGRYFDLAWQSEGKILYSSDASGNADIYVMNADGTEDRRLTLDSARDYAPFPVSGSNAIVFHSNRSGIWNVWRMNEDGSNPRQITDHSTDSNWPQSTPDGKWVVYQRADESAQQYFWKVSIDGGLPMRLSAKPALHPAVSRRTGQIAGWFNETVEGGHWKIAFLTPDGQVVNTYSSAPTVSIESSLRWKPDTNEITYVDNAGGTSNIWAQPLDGRPPRALTNFKSQQIFAFDWSPSGKLTYSRGTITSDVVLITNR
jgi:serine/threonine protein kinase/Tol biopolymer transport system component/tetratricopeptide (TPR) repeat protein